MKIFENKYSDLFFFYHNNMDLLSSGLCTNTTFYSLLSLVTYPELSFYPFVQLSLTEGDCMPRFMLNAQTTKAGGAVLAYKEPIASRGEQTRSVSGCATEG